jgi:predicted RNase H-like HicB family nuclease
MKKILIIIEKANDSYGAYSPDLPGCVAVGVSREEVEEKMYEAINFHIEGLKEEGIPIPESRSIAEYIVIPQTVG